MLMRKILGVLAIVIVLLIVVAPGTLYHLRHITPDYDETVTAAVSKPVEIWRDSAGVPHVWAANDADLYFAQGYTHAQERLWQMELFRRVGEGRLSEIFGESMVDTDKFLRTIGLWRAAALNESRLDPQQRALLSA